MAVKLYPIGIQTFERIRKENKLYIDKTEYIYRMAHSGGCYFFLGRPRRFGKSLLVSTFDSYFSGKKELFKGLAIERLETEWEEYPVLHFDMSGGKHMEKEQLEEYLDFVLKEKEAKWGIANAPKGANNRLTELINTAYAKSGKQVVVLIDEYDAPMLDVAHETESLDTLRNIMRNFYCPLKMCEPMLRFVFLIGITKFSQVSIFSELNNIKNISMDDEYAGICGITEEELLTQMSEDIDVLAAAQEMTREEAIDKLKEYYDGYHFSPSSPDVFNPYSLLNCFDDKKFGAYWFSSGTPTYLINMLRKFKVLPTKIGKTNVGAARYMLCKLAESAMTQETWTDLWGRTPKNVYVWTIEHIFPEGENIPQSWVDMIADGDTELARKYLNEYTHKIGNLTITGYNSTLGNKSFQEKRDRQSKDGKRYIGYKNGLEINNDIAKLNEWTVADIKHRSECLIQQLMEMYKFPNN